MGDEKDFRLRLPSYTSLNDLAPQRVLDEPESKIIGQLPRMYATAMETTNPETLICELPGNIASPPRLAEQRKGRPRVWNDFKFPELGDSSNAPDLGVAGKADRELPEGRNLEKGNSKLATLDEDTIGADHPHLSRDKASLVDKWVTEGLEAGAVGASGSEPNNPLPAAEPIEAPKIVTGVKVRKVLNAGQSSSDAPAPAPPPGPDSSDPEIRRQKARELLGAPNPGQQKSSTNRSIPERPKPNPKAKTLSQQITTSLIDILDVDETPVSSEKGLMSFSQPPLVPSQPALVTASLKGTPANTGLFTPSFNSDVFKQRNLITKGTEDEEDKENEYEHRLRNLKTPGSDELEKPKSPSGERELVDTEVSTRVFHRTMGQRAPAPKNKRGAKDTQKAKREAAIAAAWGPPPAPKSSTKQNKDPEPSAWKKAQNSKEEEANRINLKDLFASLEPTLDGARCFTGSLSVEFQLGLVLIHSIPRFYANRALDAKAWNKLFRPHHGLRGPTTAFINRLTTSGADIDYLLALNAGEGQYKAPAFSAVPSEQFVCYEFHCQTKNNETIIINMDDAGVTTVNRPEVFLGAANVHCPRNIWDIRATVKGVQEYMPGVDKEVDAAVQSLIENLYVYPNRTRVLMFTRTLKDSQLCISKVLMKRTTRHCYVGPENKPQTKGGSQKTCSESEKESAGTDTSGASTPNDQRVYLQVTEVQNLFFAHNPVDKTAVRIRALTPEEMVDNSRLWYEASIVSPTMDRVLESNKTLEIGECDDSWLPQDLLGNEALFSEEGEGKEEPDERSDTLSQAASIIGSAGIGQMYRIAKSVVEKIDGVGSANIGPAIDPPENVYLSGRPLPSGPLNLSTPTEVSRRGVMGMTTGGSMKMAETSSRFVAGPSDFW